MPYKNSITLGQNDDGKLHKAEGYQHIMLLAPNGKGKGVSLVVPTLLTLEESCIVHDIKLENYKLTSGYRKSIGHKIFVFNPLSADCKTHRYNPLDFIGSDIKQKINNLQKIADLLIENDTASKILFVGLALYIHAIADKVTIGEMARMINRDLEKELSEGIKKINKSNNADCFEIVSGFLNWDETGKNKAIEALRKSLYLWTNPLVDYTTSESDFDIASLKKSKATLYFGLNPTDADRLKPLMNLFYNHAFERLVTTSDSIKNENENGGVTIILDHFSMIGKLKTNVFGYLRGYKVRLIAISSDIEHIEELYGKRETSGIMSDCDFKIFFAASDCKTAQHISSLCIDKNTNKELFSWQQIMNLPVVNK